MRLFPTRYEKPLFDLFADIAHQLVSGSEILSRTLGESPRERSRTAPRLQEHAADAAALSRRIGNRLAEALITPFEAEVLHALALAMADTVAHMERAADLTVRFEIGTVPDALLEAAQLIERAAEITVEATWHLGDPAQLHAYSAGMQRLVNHGEGLVRATLQEIFTEGAEPAGMLRMREITLELRRVLDEFERCARGTDLLRIKDA